MASNIKQADFEEFMNLSRMHFVVKDEQMFRSRELRTSANYYSEWVGLSHSLTALLQLDSAYLDCFTSRPLLMRIKIGTKKPKASDIVRYHWLSFHGFVYVYYEKIKLVAEQFKLIDNKFGRELINLNFSQKIKIADQLFKQSKALRGNLVHSWHVEHPRIRFLGGLELLKESPDRTLPKGFYNLSGHLIDVKHDVGEEINKWENHLSSFHLPLAEELSHGLVLAIERFNDAHKAALVDTV